MGSCSRGREGEGSAWWKRDTTLSVDFTRKVPVPVRPGKAGEQEGGGCRVMGQEVDVPELLTSGWRLSLSSQHRREAMDFQKCLWTRIRGLPEPGGWDRL